MKLKLMLIVVLILIIAIISNFSLSEQDNTPKDDEMLIVRGSKPDGASIVLYSSYYLNGDNCNKSTFSTLDMKEHPGAIEYEKHTKNLSNSPVNYEYIIRYKPYYKNDCNVILDSIKIKAYNKLEQTDGFAELNINNLKNTDDFYYTNPLVEAKDCRTDRIKAPNKKWYSFISCDFFVNDKLKEKDVNSNYRFSLDFSKISHNEDVVYNIIPGKLYKDGVLDTKTGKIN